MTSVRYTIEEEIFAIAPSFCRAIVVARNVDNSRPSNGLEKELEAAVSKLLLDSATTLDHVRILAWQQVYKLFPTPKGERVRPSIATLVSRIRSGLTNLPFISPLVAASNIISLYTLMPSGLIDLDRTNGNLILGIANGNEHFTAFGKNRPSSILAGEVIYYDSSDGSVLCRSWNYRGGIIGGVHSRTRTAVIDIDALLHVIQWESLVDAVNTLTGLIRQYCGGESECHYLNATNQSVELQR
jgi:DNA/RNA-binding domain of Phe-tRNA-synthetase-like protein